MLDGCVYIVTLLSVHAARGSQYVELPYTVKGMDVSFSGILSYIEVSGLHQWNKIMRLVRFVQECINIDFFCRKLLIRC